MTHSIFAPPIPQKKSSNPDIFHWGELHGGSTALAIASARKQHNGPILLVTADTPSANRLEKEIAFFSQPEKTNINVFPDWETLPYDSFSPHQDIISQRLETLDALTSEHQAVFIVPINTLIQRLSPVEYLGKYLLMLKTGQKLDVQQFRRKLEKAGYLHVNQVMSHSEFSVRGSIIDLYPMGNEFPFRIDLFDDEIDTIRLFDPEDQRSGDKVDEIKLLPAREFPTDKAGISLFRQQFLTLFDASNSKESIFHRVTTGQGTFPGGIEYYLPLFFEQTATLFDYLHENTLLVLNGDLIKACEFLWTDINHRYEQHRYNPERPLLSPSSLYLTVEEVFAQLKQWPRAVISEQTVDVKAGRFNFAAHKVDDIALRPQAKEPAQHLRQCVEQTMAAGGRVLFCAETQGRKENLLSILKKTHYAPTNSATLDDFIASDSKIGLTVGLIENSFILSEEGNGLLFVTETELLGHKVSQRRRRDKQKATDESAIIRNLAELGSGQPVVHIDHGVGRYLGLQTLDAGGVTTEYLTIEYAKGSKLYVPVANLHLISRYSGGDPDHAPLHGLGSDTWSKAKKRAAEKVRDVAAQLLDVYAQRAAKPGFPYKINWQEYQRFADSFPFEETTDQAQAINAVTQDMGSKNAMDRLVCGDVGFGKTEVAMRAAFMAANEGKQVAILVPTTLLAQQHYENFKDRFADWPFNIQVMSRFVSAKQTKQVLNELQNGKVDIVIGTHKLIQDDVKYADLGLVIIDEEHRFGVRQKDKFKSLRADVDILTLTATPIPRTLNMALSGMRDLSIIATPPAKRLSIKTFVQQRNSDIIREAVMREILRGGQVYFLHNEVDTIERTAQEIAEIIPEARIAIGHGQMRERELESVMGDFYHQRYNVLVCTTIIETGIDVPSANTIIMDRADHLGLAQLHQLRGRVGRSHHQAYAYLLTPHPKRMTRDANKRLEAIANLEDLGAGFQLATHDLEIRGAGELLGDDQSGQISTIGFTLYMDMLERAVEALKQGKEPSLDAVTAQQAEIELRIPALLPEDYINDVNTRLSLYKKLASCNTSIAIDAVQIELIDRFGLLPQAAKNLVTIAKQKLEALAIGITKIELGHQSGSIEFAADTKVDPGFIIQLIQKQSKQYRFDGPTRLKIINTPDGAQQRLDMISSLLESMTKESQAA